MPHADSSLVPDTITTKAAFWEHVYGQLEPLLDGQTTWVSNLANTSSLIYNSLLAFPAFGSGSQAVNWCGFYVDEHMFPRAMGGSDGTSTDKLLLGPFCGKPACQFIGVVPGKARGVCADAFLRRKTLIVPDVDAYPGHIACDGETKSEIVSPLILSKDGVDTPIGVLDLDCLALNGFDDQDRQGLEKIAALVVEKSAW